MKKPVLLAAFSIFILCHTNVWAQNKTLGVGVATPNPNAALHVESPTGNQGFILPRLTSAQRFAPGFISVLSPTDNGLMVYDTDLNTIFIWDGTAWKNTGQVAGGVKLTFPYYDSVDVATGTNDLFSLKYNNAEPKRIMRIENQNPANGSSALSVASAGTGLTAYFQSSNPDNTSSTLYATTNSDSAGALAPVAVYGESTGTGSLGGSFRVNNAANNHPALFAETIGTGSSIMGVTSTGFSAVLGEAAGGWSNGVSGISKSTDPGSFGVLGQNHGAGPAGVFSISNSTNASASLEGSTSGLGTAGLFRIKNSASQANVIHATTSGSGAAINAENTGTGNGFAGNFRVTNATNNYPALQASSAGTASGVRVIQDIGTGPGMDVIMKNATSPAPGIAIDQLANGNGATFTINNASNASAGVSSLTNGLGSAGIFEQTNTSASSAALVAKSNGQNVAFSAVVPVNAANTGAAEFVILDNANGKNAITATTEGNGSAGFFGLNGTWNPAPAVMAYTNGSGPAISASTASGYTTIEGIQTGATVGNAGRFEITSANNSDAALQVKTAGIGPGIEILQLSTTTGDAMKADRAGLGTGSAGTFRVSNSSNPAPALVGVTAAEAGKGLAASNESNGVAFALIAGGIQVTTFNVTAASITTRAMAYHITGGGTVFTFDFIPIPSGDGELYMVYNDTGAQINVEGVQINNGEGKTIINFGGTFRGF